MAVSHQNLNAVEKLYSLVPIGANSRCFIVFGAINIRIVAESSIPFANWSPAPLVLEMPMKTCERPMLCALVLQEKWTLLCSELLQIPAKVQDLQSPKFSSDILSIYFTKSFAKLKLLSSNLRVMVWFFWLGWKDRSLRRHFGCK